MSKILPQSLIGILLGLGLAALPSFVRAGSPPVTDNLVLHLDAQAINGLNDGDRIGQWDDLSGDERHVTQGTEANQPWSDAQAIHDALPAVRFEGNQWLYSGSTASRGTLTLDLNGASLSGPGDAGLAISTSPAHMRYHQAPFSPFPGSMPLTVPVSR